MHIRQRDASASAVRVLSGPTESPAEHSVRNVKCYMLKAFCWATIRRRKRMKVEQIAVQKLGTSVYCRQRKEHRMKIAVVNKKHSSTEHVLIRAANKKALE